MEGEGMKPTRRCFLSMAVAAPLIAKLGIEGKVIDGWRSLLDKYLLPKLAGIFPKYSWRARKLEGTEIYKIVGCPISRHGLAYYATMNTENSKTVEEILTTLGRVPIVLTEVIGESRKNRGFDV